MNKILIVLGTRPEAIKLIPIIRELEKQNVDFEILNTNQHRDILDNLLNKEHIIPNYKLSICGKYNDLIETKSAMLEQMREILSKSTYSSVIVQGDTLSALVGAEYGFMRQFPVYHIEAGMRTYNINNPYPEEAFRRMISVMSTLHFCPSEDEKENLLSEGALENSIYVVGNTFVDYRKQENNSNIENKKQILITLHRRENIDYLDKILEDIKELAEEYNEYRWLFPVHPNPKAAKLIKNYLSNIENICLCEPLEADDFYNELCASEMIVSDSGGVQEECILNGKRMLVIRKVSERKTDFDFMAIASPKESIKEKFQELLKRKITGCGSNYYGNGTAARKIVEIIRKDTK